MRKIMTSIVICCILFCSGCDSGLKVVGLEITHYPSNIVYHVGESTEINLDGGLVRLVTKDGPSAEEYEMKKVNP